MAYWQHQQQKMLHNNIALQVFVYIVVALVLVDLLPSVSGQISFRRSLSELQIQELSKLGRRLENSINQEKYACDSYYDYVCSHNQPVFSILGHQPDITDVIELMTQLQNDHEDFAAKEKLMDFFTSCNKLKAVEDCYRETFEYFKPLFGYIITKNYIDPSSHEHHIFMKILDDFLSNSTDGHNFRPDPLIRYNIAMLKDKFTRPMLYFRPIDLDYEYRDLYVYREGYNHNIRNLFEYRKRNLTYVMNVPRTMLDWSLYIYQSRNKPMSYYYSTLNVHLWMTLYNSTERMREPKQLLQDAECLKLPQFVNALEEARILAIVYLKSFRKTWQDYNDWINKSREHRNIVNQENDILHKEFQLNNLRLFFTFYAQNFCDFGKELAEHIFYIGLFQTKEFFSVYSCGYHTERGIDCVN